MAFRNTLIKQGSNEAAPFGQYNTFMKQTMSPTGLDSNSGDNLMQLKGAVSMPSSQTMNNFATLKQLRGP